MKYLVTNRIASFFETCCKIDESLQRSQCSCAADIGWRSALALPLNAEKSVLTWQEAAEIALEGMSIEWALVCAAIDVAAAVRVPRAARQRRCFAEHRVLPLEKLLFQNQVTEAYFSQGTKIIGKRDQIKEKNPELVKRLKRLQLESDQREYNKMVANVTSSSAALLANDAAEFSDINEHMKLGLNLIGSIVAAGIAGWFTAKSRYAKDDPMPIFWGLIAGLFLMIVEIFLLIINVSRADNSTNSTAAAAAVAAGGEGNATSSLATTNEILARRNVPQAVSSVHAQKRFISDAAVRAHLSAQQKKMQ